MGIYIANRFHKIFKKKIKYKKNKKILILGVSFKENCADVRNSKVIDIFFRLKKLGYSVDLYDPVAEHHQVKKLYKLKLTYNLKRKNYDGLILAVKHKIFNENFEQKIKKTLKYKNVIYFVKTHFNKISSDEKL